MCRARSYALSVCGVRYLAMFWYRNRTWNSLSLGITQNLRTGAFNVKFWIFRKIKNPEIFDLENSNVKLSALPVKNWWKWHLTTCVILIFRITQYRFCIEFPLNWGFLYIRLDCKISEAEMLRFSRDTDDDDDDDEGHRILCELVFVFPNAEHIFIPFVVAMCAFTLYVPMLIRMAKRKMLLPQAKRQNINVFSAYWSIIYCSMDCASGICQCRCIQMRIIVAVVCGFHQS